MSFSNKRDYIKVIYVNTKIYKVDYIKKKLTKNILNKCGVDNAYHLSSSKINGVKIDEYGNVIYNKNVSIIYTNPEKAIECVYTYLDEIINESNAFTLGYYYPDKYIYYDKRNFSETYSTKTSKSSKTSKKKQNEDYLEMKRLNNIYIEELDRVNQLLTQIDSENQLFRQKYDRDVSLLIDEKNYYLNKLKECENKSKKTISNCQAKNKNVTCGCSSDNPAACCKVNSTNVCCVDDVTFRKQAKLFHPDKNSDCPNEARDKFDLLVKYNDRYRTRKNYN